MEPMMEPRLEGRRVVVVGAGRTGVAVARFATERGARAVLTDVRAESALAGALAGLPAAVELELGGHREASFRAADLIVISPGVPPSLPELRAARDAGIPVLGEVELASRYVKAPIVAVTGTNGKSTVTSLCGEIAVATGRPAFVGGNLGTPLITAVGTPAAEVGGIVVCEVSSFQLETCETFHPRAAVLLNITPDHLDRHGSMTAYADAKMRVVRNLGEGDVFVWNEDDPVSAEAYGRHAGGWLPTLTYSTRGRPQHRWVRDLGDGVVSFEVGGYLDGETLVLRLPPPAAQEEERYPASELALVGRHNLGNALAAFLAMRGSGVATAAEVREGARRFRPLPHRMELVGEWHGVRFYDDSKGTNVAAVVASLDGFPKPFLLIAGGRDKGGSYAPLREVLGRNMARGAILIGEAADKIASALEGVVPIHRAASMDEAVTRAAALAVGGDAVVLSPACSSFDMFDNYEHRGRVFRAAVAQLGDQRD
ncbi:MAG TPA: UDP-N-acetylmuramoyl-L-alanine--D-glutamate ligase [Polyangia bacterium]|jgi:UDP-N-acetylmuramoylalanine--D-glutamate ligase|nr:UDP-N-acetylmuramoyl-L-alanine--D-glutamate ligase [Polyangia bacterium]